MLIWENSKLAIKALFNNKMRSLLTMLGIIIGIGSVIAIMTVSSSLTTSITDTFADMGANNVTVGVQKQSEEEETRQNGLKFGVSQRSVTMDEDDRITNAMLQAVKEEYAEEVNSISLEETVGSGTVQQAEASANIHMTGINKDYFNANALTLLAGRYLTEKDVSGNKRVIMVSNKVVENVFDGDIQSALAQSIQVVINNKFYRFYIAGVYQYEEDSASFSSEDSDNVTTTAYIPITTGKEMLHTDEGYENFTIVTNPDIEDVSAFADEVEVYMNQKYYAANDKYKVHTMTMSSITSSMNSMVETVSVAIAFIAGISLLVGGIGVMNIMLVSITERTREIGTRKALGAKNSSIRMQFIIESVILCLIGGLLGIATGFVLGAAAASVLGYAAAAPMAAILGSVVFSMVIGVFFGFYPANKAARMNPIEALRYE